MITINFSKPTKEGKKQFKVEHTGDNHEPLANPAIKLNSKQACWKNIYAMSKNYVTITGEHYNITVWDKTIKGSKPMLVDLFTKVKKTKTNKL